MGFGFGFNMSSRRGGAAAFTPSARSAALQLWLPRDAGQITIVSGKASAWNDTSGQSGRSVAQATVGLRMTYTAADAGYNNQPTLAGTGTQFLISGAWGVTLVQPFTLYFCGENAQDASARGFFGSLTDDPHRADVWSNSSPSVRAYAGAATIIGAGAVTTTKKVYAVVFNGASSAIYQTDSTTPVATGNAGTGSLTGCSIGAIVGGANPINGKVGAEFFIFNAADNQANRLQAMKYLGVAFGATVT